MSRKALVTGGTRGIGLAIVERFIRDGLDVIATGRAKGSDLPKKCSFVKVDFDKDISSFLDFLEKENIDILINNAGINKIDRFTEIKEEDFIRIDKINLRIPFLLSQKVLPHMASTGWGRIINITSIFSNITKEFRASYSAETDMTREILGKKQMNDLSKAIPIRRLGKPFEVAALVSWLSSEENTYLTGQNIIIDGGYSRV